jgi:SAM-dependent methyltransferase
VAHTAQMDFFKMAISYFPQFFSGKVIDIGSLDINGGPHALFSAREYVGVDLDKGPNVDVVSKGEDVALPSGHFDVSMSSECFEHNIGWQETLTNMRRMTRDGGLLIFSAATKGRAEHGTSRTDGGYSAPFIVSQGSDYYQNVGESEAIAAGGRLGMAEFWTVVEPLHHDLFFVGLTKDATAADLETLRRFRKNAEKQFGWGYFRAEGLRVDKGFATNVLLHKLTVLRRSLRP